MTTLSKWLHFVAGAAIPFALLFAFFCFLWLKDVHDDRKHVVIAEASTPVFEGAGKPHDLACHNIKHLAAQIYWGDWASRRMPI